MRFFNTLYSILEGRRYRTSLVLKMNIFAIIFPFSATFEMKQFVLCKFCKKLQFLIQTSGMASCSGEVCKEKRLSWEDGPGKRENPSGGCNLSASSGEERDCRRSLLCAHTLNKGSASALLVLHYVSVQQGRVKEASPERTSISALTPGPGVFSLQMDTDGRF